MIGLELKADPKTQPKSVLPIKDEPHDKTGHTLSFATLLSGLKDQAKELKLPQNGTVVLSLHEQASEGKTKEAKQPASILSLLKDEKLLAGKEELKALELNPQITQDKTVSELKVLIQEAKQYLKNKISSLEGFKKSEIASLPKTLKGLVHVAQKFGIDVSKITLEEVKQNIVPKLSKEIKTVVQSDSKTDKKPHVKSAKVEKETGGNNDDVKAKEVTQPKQQIQAEQKAAVQIPLFKVAQKPAEITTQQIVEVKRAGSEIEKTQKQKNQNTLELLLRGDKALKSGTNMTADFSVATARVIAPKMQTDGEKNLEALLRGEHTLHHSESKSEIQLQKADSFEVKINEAKQMVKYLSQEVKQAIEDYKPPFMRVKVQLNPQKLGEIDLTVVQRGKNLHINLSSNNAAINTLALNAADLKIQLNNNGIQNASLNFSNMSQSEHSGAGSHAHQQQQNRQNAQQEYGYFKNEETNEELVNSLEIVVPHYA